MMTIRDPSQQDQRLSCDPLRHFTDRENAIHKLDFYLNAPSDEVMKALVFYGVGGIGKTALQLKMCERLRNDCPSVPFARFNMENADNKTRAYRDVLFNIRSDFERNFGIKFSHFDLCWAVITAHEGGESESIVKLNPFLKDELTFARELLDFVVPLNAVSGYVDKMIRQHSGLEERIRRVFRTEDVIRLREMALQNDSNLPDELIRLFALDLSEGLPAREGKACRGIIFMDTYESLWSGREGGASAQAYLLDEWVRKLVGYCLHPSMGVLPVISGRDELRWDEDDPEDWQDQVDQYLLGGLSVNDAKFFLYRCDVGPDPAVGSNDPLQEAIIECCREQPQDRSAEIACHPLYLALCAEIIRNTRESKHPDPKPETFSNIPSGTVASELSKRFLRSLDNRKMELWVTELSQTPRFDEESAIALDTGRNHHNGRAGWERLTGFSFMEPQPDGFYRFHKVMGDILRTELKDSDFRAVHEWFGGYWEDRGMNALSWYHKWLPEPERILKLWNVEHENKITERKITQARKLLNLWDETLLDVHVRDIIGDELWAYTHLSIGYALLKTPQLTMNQALATAIGHYDQALKIYTETDFPQDWAATQNNLGVAYSYLPTGDRSSNLQKAIECYEVALRVRTETDFPQDWAATQNNLGVAYSYLPTGDRSSNLQKAIECYEVALRVRTETDFPQDWAMTQNNLGAAYSHLPTGDRSSNLEKSIECYEAALRVYTETDFPREWATTQNNLGAAYSDHPRGDRGSNLQNAIECYEAARRVRTETDFPQDWATTQNNLGVAYSDLPRGDRGSNLQNAIECYEAALRVRTETDFPQDWATTQNNLGVAYSNLPTGDRSSNLQQAIECYEAALRVRTETDFPREWAMTQNNLGNAYSDLPTGDLGSNLQQAIECYEAALRVRTETDFPQDWATTQNNLGAAYFYLPTGDRGSNLQKSIKCYEAALRVYIETDFLQAWAMTQKNLGTAYSYLPTGDRSSNLEKSIECYEAALRVYTETDFPQDWGRTQNNLGKNYFYLPTGDRGTNLQKAIECHEAALRVFTETDYPNEWNVIQQNLKEARLKD